MQITTSRGSRFTSVTTALTASKELEEVQEYVLFRHIETHDDQTCCIDELSEEERNQTFEYYTIVGHHYVCSDCDFVGHTVDKMKTHVHKQHVLPRIKHDAELSSDWLEFKAAPFDWNGVAAIPDPKDTENKKLKKENQNLLKKQTELTAELEESRDQNAESGEHIKLVGQSSQSEH